MKKILVKVLFFSICFILFLSFLNINAKKLNETEDELIFAILSDIHINENDKSKSEKLNNALSIINKRVPNIDRYVFTGDYTNSGLIEEYNLFNEIYFRNVSSIEKRIALMGNHDYWNGLNIKESQKRFKNELKEKLYSSQNVKGYTLISLSTENDNIHGYFSRESINFAKKEIETSVNKNPSRPIFIFTHQPPKDTIHGSDIWGNIDLKGAFDEYPQVILFSGHSHFALNDEKGIYQGNYTVVTSGGIGAIEMEEGKIEGNIPSDIALGSQGLIVRVNKDNKVIITKIDFLNNEEIKKPWIIDSFNKEEFKYTKERKNNEKPYFSLGSSVKIDNRKGEDVNITFNQGKDDDMVHSYKIEVYEKRIEGKTKEFNNIKIEEFLTFSKFYLGKNMPQNLNVTLYNIDENKDYIVKIYAIDSFENSSSEALNFEIPKI